MEADGRRLREAARQRPEPRERRRRIALLVPADRVGDERVDVVRRQPQRVGEGASCRERAGRAAAARPRTGAGRAGSSVAAQPLELRRRRAALDRVGKARDEDRQPGREIGVDQIVRAHCVRACRARRRGLRARRSPPRPCRPRSVRGRRAAGRARCAGRARRAARSGPRSPARPRTRRRASPRASRSARRSAALRRGDPPRRARPRAGAPAPRRRRERPARARVAGSPCAAAARPRSAAPDSRSSAREHRRTGDDPAGQRRQRGDDQRGAGASGHAASLATGHVLLDRLARPLPRSASRRSLPGRLSPPPRRPGSRARRPAPARSAPL